MIAPTDSKNQQRTYQPFGAALTMWKSRRREILLAGPANTGKSRACLQKLHHNAEKYPNIRCLIVRKTRASITQTAMITLEQRVMPPGHLGSRIHWRTQEQQYEYPNGSVIAVGGIDKPLKIMSSEWDMIYIMEATELTEEDWEALTTRLRNKVMPYQQLIADCNPSHPIHWLKLRCDRGATMMLESRHEDNPFITDEDIATLDALTGVRKLRLRYGKWAAAEGIVYEQWDRALHLVSTGKLISWGILTRENKPNFDAIKHVFASMDFGFTNPGVIQVWAEDGDGRLYLLREVYQTQKTIDWWIAQAKGVKKEFRIERFACDPSEPSYIEQLCKAGLRAIAAKNAIAPGINAVQSRLKVQEDGRPRLFVHELALVDRDEKRAQVHEPYCLEQEIDAYVWPQSKNGQPVKEVPVKVNDHAVDAMRYGVMYADGPKSSGGIIMPTVDDEEADEGQHLIYTSTAASWLEEAGQISWW